MMIEIIEVDTGHIPKRGCTIIRCVLKEDYDKLKEKYTQLQGIKDAYIEKKNKLKEENKYLDETLTDTYLDNSNLKDELKHIKKNSIPKEKVRKDKKELADKIKAIYYFESVGVEDGHCISTKGQSKIDKKIKELLGEK